MDERPQNRNIKSTKVGEYRVSTAEIWRNFQGTWVSDIETLVFNPSGGVEEMENTLTEEIAVKNHDRLVEKYKKKEK